MSSVRVPPYRSDDRYGNSQCGAYANPEHAAHPNPKDGAYANTPCDTYANSNEGAYGTCSPTMTHKPEPKRGRRLNKG